MRQKAPATNNDDMPNLFYRPGRSQTNGKVKGKRGKIKSKTTMRVGGRKVSAAPANKIKYNFPVEIRHINDGVENG
jgi:hypothetical protein